MTKNLHFELRPDKELIYRCFNKYQFSPEIIPVTAEISLEDDVYQLKLNSDQQSLLETRLFAFHNYLFRNPYDASCWFIDKNWVVWRLTKDSDTVERLTTIHNCNENLPTLLYNPSMGFTLNNIVIISDGGDCLKLLIEEQQQIKVFVLRNAEAGIILDVRYIAKTCKILIALCTIKNNGDKKFTELFLLSYVRKNSTDASVESFEFVSKQTLKAHGYVQYVYLEECGDYLHCISEDCLTFENHKLQESSSDTNNLETVSDMKIPKYYWSQDKDSITVCLKAQEEHKRKIKIHVTGTELLISFDNNILLQGKCQHRLNEDLTTWKYEHGALQLELVKFETGLMWSELIEGDNSGEYLPNETLAAEIHSRMAHLCSDQADDKLEGQPCIGFNAELLEECDLQEKDNFLQRINLVTQENTHLAVLGTNNHVLFTYKRKFGQVICLRYDHDGCVWVSENKNGSEWAIKHISTFPGFGYVEASKSNRKFCISPIDGSYVAILEHMRHIFIYEKPPSKKALISKQWIVDLGGVSSSILGAVATNKSMIVLTTDKLYRLQIYS